MNKLSIFTYNAMMLPPVLVQAAQATCVELIPS